MHHWSKPIVFGGGLLMAACPLPDREIQVLTEDVNNAPVRLIEPVGLSKAQRCECDPKAQGCKDGDDPEDFEAECPMPAVIGLKHYLDPAVPANQFCKCPEGLFDQGAQVAVEFFAEDQDKIPDVDEAADTLFAAILLNADPDTSPVSQVAYQGYRLPSEPLPASLGDGYEPDGRPKPFVRTIYVGDADKTWDLCNGDARAKKGFNTFTVLVTDRDWNEVTIVADADLGTKETTVIETGVVDVANGATYDTSTYTFYCSSSDDPNNPVTPGAMPPDPFNCVDRCKEPGG